MKAARIPARYEHCELSEFDTQFDGAHPSLQKALLGARRFLEDYPVDRTGLVLTGPVGTGKTHLAVGIMKELIRTKQIDCKFYEYRDLLKEIQNSYDPSVSSSENSILKPVFECEILVIDEIGAMRSTEWVEEMVGFVLNTRYNDQKTVILTTNFPDLPAATPPKQGEAVDVFQAKMAARRHTLGDRLTDRMRSRLHEMCRSEHGWAGCPNEVPQRKFPLSARLSRTEASTTLHKEKPPIVNEVVARAHKSSAGRGLQSGINVLQVAVVPQVDRGPRMNQVGQQKIRIELLGGGQRREGGIRQRCGVLKNHPERQLAVELPIPLGANDVIVEDGRSAGAVP
jgi:DNA replication protein DnaC